MRPSQKLTAAARGPLKQSIGLAKKADGRDPEQGRSVGKNLLGDGTAFERKFGDLEFERGGRDQSHPERGQEAAAFDASQPQRRHPLERQIEQKPPHDRVDAEERDPPYIQIPVGRRRERPQSHDDQNKQDREGDLDLAVAASEPHVQAGTRTAQTAGRTIPRLRDSKRPDKNRQHSPIGKGSRRKRDSAGCRR